MCVTEKLCELGWCCVVVKWTLTGGLGNCGPRHEAETGPWNCGVVGRAGQL